MRPSYGTSNSTTSSKATMLYSSDTNTRMFSISFRARTGNNGMVYIGSDTAVLAASGYELDAGDTYSFMPAMVRGTVKAHVWHSSAADTTDKLDWVMLLET